MSLRVVLWASLALASVFAVQVWQAGSMLYPDVWGFWTFGRYALTHAPATIYDDAALHAFQAGLGIPDANGFYPYPYPPWFLLAVTPLGWLHYPAAALLWRAVTFGGLVLALGAWRWPRDGHRDGHWDGHRDGHWDRALLLAVAPACALSFVVGQNGFLTAALMLGGVRLLPGRPVLGGALLGALAYKPQFAVLVPFFLVFGGHWRALAGAALAVALLTTAAILAFGAEIWPAWLHSMQEQALTLTAGRTPKLDQMPTVTAAVQLLGGSAGLGHFVQGVAAMGALAALWRGRPGLHPAVLPLATLVATPYAFGYDLPVIAGAALLAVRPGGSVVPPLHLPPLHLPPPAGNSLRFLLLGCVLMPCAIAVPGAVVVLPVLFAVTLWRIVRR